MPKSSKPPSKEEVERATPYMPPGLINHGNTCFMNSVLQGLIATKLLHDLVIFSPITPELQRRLPTPLHSSRSPQLTNGHGIAGEYEQKWDNSMPIGDQFLQVLFHAWVAQSERGKDPLSPKPLLTALGRKYQQYCDFAQQDAHEFLRILFDAIRMEEIDVIRKRQPPPPKPGKKPRKRKRAHNRSSFPSSHNTTPSTSLTSNDTHTTDTSASAATTTSLLPFPDMLFAGQLTSILVCQECKRVSQTFEDFYDISLSVNLDDYVTPSSALFSSPPFGTAAHFLSNPLKNVGKGKGKEANAKEEKEAEREEQTKSDSVGGGRHGRERRRDKFRKLAKRIAAGVTTTAQASTGTGTKPVALRASSVPPEERGTSNNDRDMAIAKAAGGREALRRTRSRSLDHARQMPNGLLAAVDVQVPEMTIRESSETGEASEPREQDQTSSSGGEGWCSGGRDEAMTAQSGTSETVESDWSVVKEGDVAEAGEEKVDEAVVTSPSGMKKEKEKKEKRKEGDSWTKLSKRISISVGLTRNSKERDREGDRERAENESDRDKGKPQTRSHTREFVNAMLVDIRGKRKSRESSPDPAGFALASSSKWPSKPPEVPPVPPLPLNRPATSPSPHLSPPIVHTHHHHSNPNTPSPLSQQAFQSPPTSSLYQETEPPKAPSPIESTPSPTLFSSASTTPLPQTIPQTALNGPRSHRACKSQDTARPPPIRVKHKSRELRSPTPAEIEYLRRVLADVDLSDSKSSPTPSGGWPASTTSSYSLVNPFALLVKSGGAKSKGNNSTSGSENVTSANNEPPSSGPSEADLRQRLGSNISLSQYGSKWASWWGMNRLSGIEECLRLFTSVEVLDHENMVGCRRCWKIANQGKEEEEQGRDGGDERDHNGNEDDGEDDDDDDDDESSSDDERSPRTEDLKTPPFLSNPPAEKSPSTPQPRLDTPGGIPIPIISTTEPESLFEPPSVLPSTPTRSRMTHPLRSNSADFINLSFLPLREGIRLDTDNLTNPSLLARNASSPSIPSGLSSPVSPYPRSSTVGMNTRDSLGIPRAPSTRRHARIWPSTDGESDECESGSAVDSSRSGGEGDGTDFLDVDDGLSIGSSSSISVPPSGVPSISTSENDISEKGAIDDGISVPGEVSALSSAAASSDAITAAEPSIDTKSGQGTEVKKKTKPPKKPKPVIMRPAYKRYLIATAPPVLVIHLKRFQQTTKTPLVSFTATYGFKKLDDYVTFPEYLDLTPFLAPRKEDFSSEKDDGRPPDKNERCLYRLYAVVVHIGNMLGGHYIAYTAVPDQPPTLPDTMPSGSQTELRPSTSESGLSRTSSNVLVTAPPLSTKTRSKSGRPERQWAYISDMFVKPATLDEVLKAKAYICMYERI